MSKPQKGDRVIAKYTEDNGDWCGEYWLSGTVAGIGENGRVDVEFDYHEPQSVRNDSANILRLIESAKVEVYGE